MEQLRQPNLSVVGKMGYCLTYAREVFGVAAKYADAYTAWQNAQYKHTEALPDVAVPVWFNWTGTVNGVTKNWGHVAVYVPGQGIFTSPIRSSQVGHGVYASVQTLSTAIGGTYLGWSEDINNVRVVQGGSMLLNLATARILGYSILGRLEGLNGAYDADYNAYHVGKELGAKVDEFWASGEGVAWRARLNKYIADANALPSVKTELTTANAEVAKLKAQLTVAYNDMTTAGAEIARLKAELSRQETIVKNLVLTNEALIGEVGNLTDQLTEALKPHPVTWSSIWSDIKSMFNRKKV